MDSWRIIAARAIAAESEQQVHGAAPVALPLPRDIEEGLAALVTIPPPGRLRPGSAWDQIKADAARMTCEGWAANALALGWHPLELFGVGAQSSATFEGLAVWLAGRRLVLIDGRSAIVAQGNQRAVYNRMRGFDATATQGLVVFLWEFGRK